jgi:hypothetical protein
MLSAARARVDQRAERDAAGAEEKRPRRCRSILASGPSLSIAPRAKASGNTNGMSIQRPTAA